MSETLSLVSLFASSFLSATLLPGNSEEVLLTALEYRLLMVFINHPQQVLSCSQLLEGIWDAAGDFVNDNTLTVYIKRLREKLERDPQNPSIIVTVRGLGYRLELHHAA